MNLRDFAKPIEKLVADNSPAILTAVGVIGSASAAYLTGKATFKAADVLADAEKSRTAGFVEGEELTNNDKVKLVWKLYIPPLSVLAVSCGAIIMSNRISTKRAAALATAYTLAERAHSEYAEKVKEHFGLKKEQDVKDAIAQDNVTKNPPQAERVFVTGKGDTLCKDELTGRYFLSTMEEIKAAQNHINSVILGSGDASLNSFYDWLGLESIPMGEEVGWSGGMMDVSFSSTLTDKNEPCLVFSFRTDPVRNYFRTH